MPRYLHFFRFAKNRRKNNVPHRARCGQLGGHVTTITEKIILFHYFRAFVARSSHIVIGLPHELFVFAVWCCNKLVCAVCASCAWKERSVYAFCTVAVVCFSIFKRMNVIFHHLRLLHLIRGVLCFFFFFAKLLKHLIIAYVHFCKRFDDGERSPNYYLLFVVAHDDCDNWP